MASEILHQFSSQARELAWERLDDEQYDLCLIGGGITGAGVARDAASRGMKVCLIEQGDFASGTSSRSSKLIHGGIRYLENLEFGLVFEALSERRILFKIAPHLVHPLEFLIPLYSSGRVSMFKMGLGMWLYDALSLFMAPKLHERLNVGETIKRLPYLSDRELLGSYLYSDAYMDDDRLVIETLRSAASFGASCLNYVKAGTATFDSQGKILALEAANQLNGEKRTIRAKHFISTVGPWTDQFASSLFQWKKILRPTKGVHLTFSRERFPLKDAVVMAAEARIVFGIPRHEMVIVGTTDTDFQGDPATVHTDSSDVEYLLGVISRYFAPAKITKEDIIASYAGVRPLVDDGSSTESKTSREHVVIQTPHNVTFVAGGKYTTYRRMAGQVVEKVLPLFPIEKRIQYSVSNTKEPINPIVTAETLRQSFQESELWSEEYKISVREAEVLTQRHGPEAKIILEEGRRAGLKNVWEMEALFAIKNTMCLHLRDFMLRRAPLFLAYRDHGHSLVDGIARVFQNAYGWSAERVNEEIELFLQHERAELGWHSRL